MTALVTRPGVYSLSVEDYHGAEPCASPSLSASGAIKLMQTCPAIYWHERQNPSPPSLAMDLGTIAHRLVLEGVDVTDRHVIVPPGFSMEHTKKHGDLIAEIKATGKRPLREDDAAVIRAMADRLREHPFASAAFANGIAEQSLFWRDRRFGIWCRARPDWMPANGTIFADYKTIVDASPEAIRKAVANFGYHQQDAWYCDGIRALGICAEPVMLFVFQSKSPPYLVTCATLDADTREWGRTLNDKARATFAECVGTGVWPGYADEVISVTLPGWEARRLQDLSDLGALAVEFQSPTPECVA